MSRSIRRPFCNESYKGSRHKQFAKRVANKKIRNSDEVPNGKAYRKFYEPWKINDYYVYQSPRDIEKYWPEWWKLLRK
jgi:hypothetical protein